MDELEPIEEVDEKATVLDVIQKVEASLNDWDKGSVESHPDLAAPSCVLFCGGVNQLVKEALDLKGADPKTVGRLEGGPKSSPIFALGLTSDRAQPLLVIVLIFLLLAACQPPFLILLFLLVGFFSPLLSPLLLDSSLLFLDHLRHPMVCLWVPGEVESAAE